LISVLYNNTVNFIF